MASKALALVDMPLIVILGSTATGKSKLGIGLARALNGEIISADSMQVYKGLDIITNKVTAEEQREIPHHLINIISPPSEFTVVRFKERALQIIQDLFKQKKIPIIVGGTNYYIESLLWDFLVEDKEPVENREKALQQRKDLPKTFDSKGGEDGCCEDTNIYEELKKVDPQRAEQLHPNNIRKIARSLQVYETTGKTHSELLKDQKGQDGASHLSGPLRFSKALVFWLTCNQEVLDQRISDRMEKMVEEGLANEVTEFYKQYRQGKSIRTTKAEHESPVEQETLKNTLSNISDDVLSNHRVAESKVKHVNTNEPLSAIPDTASHDDNVPNVRENSTEQTVVTPDSFEDGLLQAIGFKEFHSYITSTDNDSEKREALFREGLDKLKRTTIKYSKKQQTWVRNRFLARPKHNVPDVYDLDVTNLDNWNETVYEKALQISTAFVAGDTIPYSPMSKITVGDERDENRKYVCDLCDGKIIIGDTCWEAHYTSKKHRRRTSRKRKRELDDSEIS